jgi:hypothetical protein
MAVGGLEATHILTEVLLLPRRCSKRDCAANQCHLMVDCALITQYRHVRDRDVEEGETPAWWSFDENGLHMAIGHAKKVRSPPNLIVAWEGACLSRHPSAGKVARARCSEGDEATFYEPSLGLPYTRTTYRSKL